MIPSTEGLRTDYSFVRDAQGTMYWVERGNETVIKKRVENGQVITHATGGLRHVFWMTATADGTLFLMDAGDLRRVSQTGTITTLVAKLSGLAEPNQNVSDPNYHMGLWTDNGGAVYVAVAAERLVVRVTTSGDLSVVAKSTEP